MSDPRDGLPERSGPRPRVTTSNPQTQLDQQPATPLSDALIEAAAALDGVVLAPSNRAPPGTTGFHLEPAHANGPPDAFLLGHEFAHVHPGPDHSLHMILPDALKREAIERGWAEPHPMAGQPTVSPHTVLVYAPRNDAERSTVDGFIRASWSYARGSR